ncbi:hypothetical protein CEE44_00140 [Candidatus Woesearchaeota archaeon B3_Woes]|nr:MAG: hypothetical protein CEE44_00140 [Candidatus Woesearchaeota archaeon B3_Woes]
MEKFTKKQQIKELKEGDIVNDIFVVKIKRSISEYSKGHFFTLILSDSSGGSIEYKYWGDFDQDKVKAIYNLIAPDSVVLVKGKVSSYQNKLQIGNSDPNNIRVLNQDEYEGDFIAGPQKDIDEMYSGLMSKIDSIKNEDLKKLLLDVFNSLGDKFKQHPGAIQIHHNWRGGLLQHTLEIVEYCETSCRLFPELDRDLLISGTLLHDIGKLEEIETTSRIKGTRKGQFIGHLTLGVIHVADKLKDSSVDDLLKEKLLHLIVSHHGELEYGSPKKPMFAEAVVLYFADQLSSRTSEFIEFIKENKDATDDDSMYHRRHSTNIFLR